MEHACTRLAEPGPRRPEQCGQWPGPGWRLPHWRVAAGEVPTVTGVAGPPHWGPGWKDPGLR